MNIVEFLEARLAEDERIAQTSIDVTYRTWRPPGKWTFTDGEEEAERESQREFGGRCKICVHARVYGGNFVLNSSGNPRTQNPDMIHIARHDPARVLRQCAALRKVVVEHGSGADPCDAHDGALRTIPCETLCALAAIWSDHPSFEPDWA